MPVHFLPRRSITTAEKGKTALSTTYCKIDAFHSKRDQIEKTSPLTPTAVASATSETESPSRAPARGMMSSRAARKKDSSSAKNPHTCCMAAHFDASSSLKNCMPRHFWLTSSECQNSPMMSQQPAPLFFFAEPLPPPPPPPPFGEGIASCTSSTPNAFRAACSMKAALKP